MDVKCTRDWHSIRVYIDKTLYLYIPMKGFEGLQSWMDDDRFFIEIYKTSGKNMLLEYRERDKWEQILSKLNEILPK
tara:strand:+ start:4453 stop:4683 length:231 start_codon:yes stop_codon:yes gene_type:complete